MTATGAGEPRHWVSSWFGTAKTGAQKAKDAAKNHGMHIRDGWDKGWEIGKRGAERVGEGARHAARVSKTAVMKGAEKAKAVISLQKMAGLEPKLMQRSAASVIDRANLNRDSDKDWQRGYSVVAAHKVPPVVIWPDREADRKGLDLEAGG